MSNSALEAESVDLNNEDNEDTQKDKYLAFSIGEEDYDIEIRYVTEVVMMQSIAQVPDMPDSM